MVPGAAIAHASVLVTGSSAPGEPSGHHARHKRPSRSPRARPRTAAAP